MGMWGVEEDDTKGKARLPSTPTIEGAWFPKNCSSISMSEFVEIAGLGQSLSGLFLLETCFFFLWHLGLVTSCPRNMCC